MAIVARHFRITGKVQGVGYRYFTQCTARELGLVGWVKNMPDGSVEAWAKGPAPVMATFHQELSFGPYNAQVVDVEIAEADSSQNYSEFRILR